MRKFVALGLLVMGVGLAGCIVVPDDDYGYHHHHHWDHGGYHERGGDWR